jgi:hypothetical protein
VYPSTVLDGENVLSFASSFVLGTDHTQLLLDHDDPVEVSFIRNLTVLEPEVLIEKM